MYHAFNRMLKYTIALILVALSLNVNGQGFAERQLYLKNSIGGGNYFGGNISVDYIGKKGTIIATGVSWLIRNASNLPDDYISLNKPREVVSFVYISTGKSWTIKESSWRINIIGGLGIDIYDRPTNFIVTSPLIISFFGAGYEYDYEMQRNTSLGVIQKGHVEFDISRIFGLALGYTFIYSQYTTALMGDISLLIGIVGKKK